MSRSRACTGQKRDGSRFPCFNIFPEIVARAIVSRMTSPMNMILKYTVQSWSTVSCNFIHDGCDVLRFKKYDSFRKSHGGPTKMSSCLRFHDSGVPLSSSEFVRTFAKFEHIELIRMAFHHTVLTNRVFIPFDTATTPLTTDFNLKSQFTGDG